MVSLAVFDTWGLILFPNRRTQPPVSAISAARTAPGPAKKPLPLPPANDSQPYQSQHGGTQWHLLMAASTLTVLPMVLLFFFTQRTFLRGITFMRNVDIN